MKTEKTTLLLGWRVYGVGVAAIGLACLAFGDFDPGQTVPRNFPARTALAYASRCVYGRRGVGPWNGAGLAGNTGILVQPAPPSTGIEGFAISGLTIQNYSQNGIQLAQVENFSIKRGKYTNNGQYGIFPLLSSRGRVESNEVSGSNDTGLYIGQSSDVTMADNIATNNTIGLEVENSSHLTVQGNSAFGNSTGILVDVLPGLEVAATSDVVVAGNVLGRNNRPNPSTDPYDILSYLPSGIGLLNVGGDQVVVSNNLVLENNTVGIAVIQLPIEFAMLDSRVQPLPDFYQVRGNLALGNGSNPAPNLLTPVGADLAWDGSGTNDCWHSAEKWEWRLT